MRREDHKKGGKQNWQAYQREINIQAKNLNKRIFQGDNVTMFISRGT